MVCVSQPSTSFPDAGSWRRTAHRTSHKCTSKASYGGVHRSRPRLVNVRVRVIQEARISKGFRDDNDTVPTSPSTACRRCPHPPSSSPATEQSPRSTFCDRSRSASGARGNQIKEAASKYLAARADSTTQCPSSPLRNSKVRKTSRAVGVSVGDGVEVLSALGRQVGEEEMGRRKRRVISGRKNVGWSPARRLSGGSIKPQLTPFWIPGLALRTSSVRDNKRCRAG